MKRYISLLVILVLICSSITYAETTLQVNDEILFGYYEQDGNEANGKEPICWQVLEINEQNGSALVISKYLLDCIQYNTSTKSTTWANTTLSKWIQDTFIPDAFSETEQNLIVPTNISGTTQKVFVLDQKQMKKYLQSFLCSATQYAINRGVFKSNVDGVIRSSYWVRLDKSSTWGAFVGSKGSIHTKNNKVTVKDNGVRPAMYLSLDYDNDTEGAIAADLKNGEKITLGSMTIQITRTSIVDKLPYYSSGMITGMPSETYMSGSEAEYITVQVSIKNNAPYYIDYTQGVSVTLTDGDNCYRGWIQQYNKVSDTAFLNPDDRYSISSGETGYYCFGCTVPNNVLNDLEQIFITIHVQGEEITHYIHQ